MVKVNYDLKNKKVLGFYPDFINYKQIPEPYIEVSEERHAELVAMANSGKELYITENNDFALRDIELTYTAEQREAERIAHYKWVDDQISKCEREKVLDNADVTALDAQIKALRIYANKVWATQQQAGYPQTVTYPTRPTAE